MIELISSHIGFVLSVLYAILWYYVVKLTSKGFLNVKNYLSLFLILLPAMVAIISVSPEGAAEGPAGDAPGPLPRYR